MAAPAPEQLYCEKCGRTKKSGEFYTSNNLEKYPNGGKLNQCKDCISMHIDNWDPQTYLWILEELDVPYVPKEWNNLLAKYVKEGKTIKSMTILGRYLSTMKLSQHKKFRWKDTEYLRERENQEIRTTMMAQGYGEAEIDEAVNKRVYLPPEKPVELQPPATATFTAEDYFDRNFAEEANDFNDDLTDEDKIYLRLKWGKTYKPEEWIKLEQLYNDMMESYDIQTAGHIDTLKFICKTSLKMNQFIDMGDVESYQKMSKVYDSLMKSGKFTAAQNKAEAGEFLDSIGELVSLCETDGYIERYYIDKPNDMVDKTLQDMQSYTRTLIEKETNITALVEQAIKQNMREDEEDKEDSDEIILDDIETTYEDYEEFNDFIEEEQEADKELLTNLLEEGGEE